MIRVVLIDDHQMVREALGQILEDSGLIRVVGVGSTCARAQTLMVELKPDVLVLDYSLADGSALPLIEDLSARGLGPILVLTVHESPHHAIRVLEAGAQGYVIKGAALAELVQGIQAVRRGEVYVSPALAPTVIAGLRRPRRERVGLQALSPREFELLRLLGSGLGLQDAARQLNVSTSTASTYRGRLLEKLELRGTADLIRFALEQGLVP